jgi:phosphoribosylformylglycinamidine synthase
MKITPEIIAKHNLTMDEYKHIVELLGREPNITELGMFSVMYSEHCSYKSSKPVLKMFPTRGDHVLQGPGENAGIVDIGDKQAIVFKIESHNHPSAVEPYQGAATGVGGILRDIFTMGARPIASLNSLRFGNLSDPRVRYIFTGVVGGISGYGNATGVPTVAGEIYFDDAYKDNPLVNVMNVGIIDHDDIVRAEAEGVGNPVIYVGSTTGRDGLGGAAFASRELHDESEEDRPAVQVGDPFMEKLLIEACLEIVKKDYLVSMQDMGAAGLTSSSAEMASRGDVGIEMDISLVPKRAEGMTPYEVMLSESQERMLLVVKKGYEKDAIDAFHKWGLSAVAIGHVTEDGTLRVKDKGEVVAHVQAKALTDLAPVYNRPSVRPGYLDEVQGWKPTGIPLPKDYNDVFRKLISSPTIASKKWVWEQYDYTVGTDTVVKPGEADAAVMRIKGTKKGVALSIDGNGRYCYLNPYEGGKIAVAEAARNIVCVGAMPAALTNGLNFGNPEKEEVFWQLTETVRGMKDACVALGIPVVSGNVSLYNETNGVAIYPTPVVGMVGLLSDLSKHTTQGFKQAGDIIVLLGSMSETLGGSEYLKVVHNLVTGDAPKLDLYSEKKVQSVCLEATDRGLIKSAHDVSEGGLAVALAECSICGKVGAAINLQALKNVIRPDALLFGEMQSCIVVSVAKEDLPALSKIADSMGAEHRTIGMVGGDRFVISGFIDLDLSELMRLYLGGIPKLVPSGLSPSEPALNAVKGRSLSEVEGYVR